MTQVVGDVYSNRYEVERAIARGGMADVYLARDQYLDRPVAVKVLFPEFARDQAFVERFRREAQSAAMLNHPNIVSVYDYGQERGTYFIVMEFVEGRSLRDILRTDGALPPMTVARIGSEIASALDFAHRHGVVHRDIKPGNVMITPSGQVKVTDYGIAANPTDAKQGLTQTGSVIGTATYFSPEQAQGYQVDGRTDVYALGVVMYEMLTGQAPFSGDSPVAVAMKHVREQPVPPSQYVPDLPPDLERIVLTAMSKDLATRYQSAEEMRADLIAFGRGRPINAPAPATIPGHDDVPTMAAAAPAGPLPPEYDEPHWEQEPRKWGAIVATVIGLALLAGVIVFALVATKQDTKKTVAKIEVPDVVGKKYTDAQTELEAAGFRVVLRFELSDSPPDEVVEQRPEAGLLAKKGASVVLIVSTREVTVPDLTGQTEDQARSALQKLNLGAEIVEFAAPNVAPGTVITTNPKPGTKVNKGSTVKVIIAKKPQTPIPSVIGKDQATASSILSAAGFQAFFVPAPSDTVPAGFVISQSPAPNTPADEGTQVTVQVSTGPQSIPVTNTVGQPCGSAANSLTAQGFNVQITGNTSGHVIAQNPNSGSYPPGTQISLTCA